jgi:hypothetical protein
MIRAHVPPFSTGKPSTAGPLDHRRSPWPDHLTTPPSPCIGPREALHLGDLLDLSDPPPLHMCPATPVSCPATAPLFFSGSLVVTGSFHCLPSLMRRSRSTPVPWRCSRSCWICLSLAGAAARCAAPSSIFASR